MKLSFFAAALIGLTAVQTTQAVTLEGHDFDFADYELAEIDGEGKGDSTADVEAKADADCEETVGGITLRLSTPECQKQEEKPEVPFDQQMLLALQELSGKSMTLYEALKAQFARSTQLKNSKTMVMSGNLKFTPAGDGPMPEPAKAEPKPVENKDVSITVKQEDKAEKKDAKK